VIQKRYKNTTLYSNVALSTIINDQETSRGIGQHTFVFPMRVRNRMRVSEYY